MNRHTLEMRAGAVIATLFFTIGSAVASAQSTRLGQTWGGTGEDFLVVSGVDVAGDVYLVGATTSFGALGSDGLLLKVDSTGVHQWARRWGGNGDDGSEGHMLRPSSGELYLGGCTTGFGAVGDDAVFSKWDSSGALLWARRWGANGTDHVDSVAVVDATGDVYAGGGTDSFGSSGQATLLLKLDAGGVLQWARTWDWSAFEDSFNGVAYYSGTDVVYAAGNTDANGRDALLIKYDSAGNVVWVRTWGGPGPDDTFGVIVDASGNIYTWGGTSSFGVGNRDMFIVKWDDQGNVVWDLTWGTAGEDDAGGVTTDATGRLFLTGNTPGCGGADSDALVMELDPATGQVLWSRTWGGPQDEALGGAIVDATSLYTAGLTFGCAGSLSNCTGVTTTPSGTVASITNGTVGSPAGAQPDPTLPVSTPIGTTCPGSGDTLLLALELPFSGVQLYCDGKTNSLACVPFISTTGTPSAASTAPFRIDGNDVMPNEGGFIIYGSKKSSLAFHGGTLCVKLPFVRTPVKSPKNTGGGCSGWQLARNFNATIQSGTDPSLTAGRVVTAQYRQRNPSDPAGFGDGLTDGVRFTIQP